MAYQNINPSTVRSPPASYSHVRVTPLGAGSNLITIAGQVGVNPDGSIPESASEQSEIALRNVVKCLTAAGATVEDVVRVVSRLRVTGRCASLTRQVVYLPRFQPGGPQRLPSYEEVLGVHRPPLTVIGVETLGRKTLEIEIEVTAVTSPKS